MEQFMRRMQMAFLFVLCTAFSTGCGTMVSKKEFFRTSFSADRPAASPYVAARVDEHHRVAHIQLPGLADEEWIVDRTAYRTTGLQRSHTRYLSNVFGEIDQLRRELVIVAVRADQKGAAGRAAIDTKMRSFLTNLRLINRYVEQYHRSPSEWDAVKVKIEVELDSARSAVREAAEVIKHVHDEGSLLVGSGHTYGL